MAKGKLRTREEQNMIALTSATLMVKYDWGLQRVADEIRYPMSSVYKIMMERLPRLDKDLFKDVRHKLEAHKHHIWEDKNHDAMPV